MDEGRNTSTSDPAHDAKASPALEAEEFYTKLSSDDTIVKRPITFELKETLKIERTARGGEALIGEAAHLAIHVKRSDTPLHVQVTGRLVVGRSVSKADDTLGLDLKRYGAQIMGVSRHHMVIIKDSHTLMIEDLNSTNGTFINGFRLLSGEPRFLRDGDELHLGQFVMRVFYRMSDVNRE
ncbi:MAG: FHA domain-containing protein [Anaerolineae bacterium]|nr:FHA domain-containing protein [Anaerolineae bacterium]